MWPLLVQTFAEWREDKATRLAAALSFYTALSIAPLLVITIAISGLALGQEAARGEILGELQSVIGAESARTINSMIEGANRPRSGIVATVFGVTVLLFGASGVFVELQGALNSIWGVESKPRRGFWGIVRERFLSFAMVIVLAFLLLVALVLSSLLALLGTEVAEVLPGEATLWHGLTWLVSLGVATLTFVLVFKFLPDVEIAWRDVWFGALVTALLFTLGKLAISFYIGRAAVASTYGAAGSVMVLLLWVYYSSQILFFGAELTQVYARMYGSRIVASEDARPGAEAPGDPRHAAG
jgi:membrane protein